MKLDGVAFFQGSPKTWIATLSWGVFLRESSRQGRSTGMSDRPVPVAFITLLTEPPFADISPGAGQKLCSVSKTHNSSSDGTARPLTEKRRIRTTTIFPPFPTTPDNVSDESI